MMLVKNSVSWLFPRQPLFRFLIILCALFLVAAQLFWIYSPQELYVLGGRVIPQYRPDHHGKHGGHPHHGHDQGNDTLLSNHTMTPAERCAGFPKLDDILIVIKTGASEAYAKVPIQFMTFLQCVEDNVLVFSDMEQELGPYHVYDSLDQVTEAAKKDNPDFDLYRMQQEFKHDGNEIASTLHGQKNDDAWRLDKYKNIHIATKSYDMRPEASWYIFIDADTYIVWSSLLPWLGGMDPDKPLYMGSKAMMGDMGFAHGGSGYVLSHKAMEKFVGEDPGVANRYDEPAIHECCGDVNLAVALYDKDIVKLDSYWPMINGESPRTIPFGPSHWCQPIITMHHISVQHTNDFWWFEQSRLDPEKPILIHEIYDFFLRPHLRPWRGDWDNEADDETFYEPSEKDSEKDKKWQQGWTEVQKNSWKTHDGCKQACIDNNGCFQYKWQRLKKRCSLSWSIKLGQRQPLDVGKEENAESGTLMGRVNSWVVKKGECKKPEWVSAW